MLSELAWADVGRATEGGRLSLAAPAGAPLSARLLTRVRSAKPALWLVASGAWRGEHRGWPADLKSEWAERAAHACQASPSCLVTRWRMAWSTDQISSRGGVPSGPHLPTLNPSASPSHPRQGKPPGDRGVPSPDHPRAASDGSRRAGMPGGVTDAAFWLRWAQALADGPAYPRSARECVS